MLAPCSLTTKTTTFFVFCLFVKRNSQSKVVNFFLVPDDGGCPSNYSIAGVFARARRASLSVSTLSNLLFINKNTDVASELQNIDLFTGSLENVDDEIMDEIENFLQENNGIVIGTTGSSFNCHDLFR
jgi:hypothetical protein